MPENSHRIILTGGPGSGKTTLINELKNRGYPCSLEAGRAIIQDQSVIDGIALPWADPNAFAQAMLIWELRSWHEASSNKILYFYDRGLPDIAGYLLLCGLAIPKHLDKAITLFRYSENVFIAPPWTEVYTQDKERKQTEKEAEETYLAMIAAYKKYHYNLTELPKIGITDRANFIINKI
ncbi:AAA family ATPase [Proteus alimentorum]|uniref:AAA family ATPase n=1 Tax=Proteus alimentorum TaxID=1973495 RepID=A0ABS0IYJ8_9GAMM|nr:AAA family ATPase [Proteus alimentorum]MBG2877535.1 AAA family ATPase [Proteus alimentorum]MBG2881098.1 AAA family ATPase [Proteus alimentorum]